jgi:hypothetical protein
MTRRLDLRYNEEDDCTAVNTFGGLLKCISTKFSIMKQTKCL